jgi:predicted ArsR family transcriptional regulator
MAVISSRERIVELLRIHGTLTSADLVRALEITATAVRQHLDRLVAEGLVEVTGLQRGRGRPRKIYALSEKADSLFPHSYDALALELLEAISRLPEGAELFKRVLAVRREIWNERYGRRVTGESLEQQVAAIMALFNEKGGLTEHDVQADGTHLLVKRNCNISRVAAQYPEFCEIERAWLQEVLNTSVDSLQSRAAGDPACVFRIHPAAKAASAGQSQDHGKGE